MSEPDSDLAAPPGTKLSRNEGRKLIAGLFNNLGAALLLAAFVQPVLAVVQQHRGFTFPELGASLAFAALGAILIRAAQLVVHRLEE